jgi:hypothetical protein
MLKMIRISLLWAAAALAGIGVPGAPGFAAAPPGTATPPAGSWQLIPLPDTKVPAAWVINTENGDTYLCGAGSSDDGQARVACIQANFHHARPPG